jgi:hypothetical protein
LSKLVAAYVCPRGVFAIECKRSRSGIQVLRAFEAPGSLGTAESAVAQLVGLLEGAGIRRADVAVALRGFGSVHHVLALPRARNELLGPIVERELRRLEPQLADAVVAWFPLLDEEISIDAPPQRQFLVAGAPREQINAIERGLSAAGHQLLHLTALPAALQRLVDEFEPTMEAMALVAPLPDGAFFGFCVAGGMRLVVEPPMQEQDDALDPPAMAEEVELGAMFVRQQFRGAQLGHVTIAASPQVFADAQGAFTDRLGIPVSRLAVRELDASGLVALGAILDSSSAIPLSFAGKTRERGAAAAKSALRMASMVAVFAAAAIGVVTVVEALRARDAASALVDARRQIEQQSVGLLPVRQTAERRKLIRDAVSALRFVARDRLELQQALNAVGGAIFDPVQLDSIVLDRGSAGWLVVLGGSITEATNGRAVQTLHDFYRDLPRRLVIDQPSLEQLVYADSGAHGRAMVRFQLAFVVPRAKTD